MQIIGNMRDGTYKVQYETQIGLVVLAYDRSGLSAVTVDGQPVKINPKWAKQTSCTIIKKLCAERK